MSGQVIRFFSNTSMINGHDGLALIAKKEGIDVNKIEAGQYVVFTNKALNRVKVYAASQVMAYLRLPGNRKIDLRVIREIPKVFNGTRINYDKALETVITDALEKRPK